MTAVINYLQLQSTHNPSYLMFSTCRSLTLDFGGTIIIIVKIIATLSKSAQDEKSKTL